MDKQFTDWRRPILADGNLDVRVGDVWEYLPGEHFEVMTAPRDGEIAVWSAETGMEVRMQPSHDCGHLISRNDIPWDIPTDKREGRWVSGHHRGGYVPGVGESVGANHPVIWQPTIPVTPSLPPRPDSPPEGYDWYRENGEPVCADVRNYEGEATHFATISFGFVQRISDKRLAPNDKYGYMRWLLVEKPAADGPIEQDGLVYVPVETHHGRLSCIVPNSSKSHKGQRFRLHMVVDHPDFAGYGYRTMGKGEIHYSGYNRLWLRKSGELVPKARHDLPVAHPTHVAFVKNEGGQA